MNTNSIKLDFDPATDFSDERKVWLENITAEFYDRILSQSKDQYLNKGFERVVCKWYKEACDHNFGFVFRSF